MTSLSKSFTLEEVEALLAAERERCAKVAADPEAWWPHLNLGNEFGSHHAIAAAIRSLPPKPPRSQPLDLDAAIDRAMAQYPNVRDTLAR